MKNENVLEIITNIISNNNYAKLKYNSQIVLQNIKKSKK